MRLGDKSPEAVAMVERINFFIFCGKISKYFTWPIMLVSLSTFLFSVYSILYPAKFLFAKLIFMDVMIFVGIMSIFSGLLLLTKE